MRAGIAMNGFTMSADFGGWFRVSNHAVSLIPKIGTTAFSVLMILAKHANQERRCWPSLEAIALASGLKRRAAQMAVAALKEAGAIEFYERRTRSGQKTNGYLIAEEILPEMVRKKLRISSAKNCAPSSAIFCAQNKTQGEPNSVEQEFDQKAVEQKEFWFSEKEHRDKAEQVFHELLSMLPRGRPKEDIGFVGQAACLIVGGASIVKEIRTAFAGPKQVEVAPARPIAFVRRSLGNAVGEDTLKSYLKLVPPRSRCQFKEPEYA